MDDLVFIRRVRRAIHRRPELQHQEHRTAALIERMLARFGLQTFRPAPTSVAAIVGSADAQPAIGFRADLDALPISEATNKSYASRNHGVMHACGHDGHAAALLGLARRLAAAPPRRESVLLVFQQAEEGHPSGAPRVLRGLRPGLRPREFIGFHLWPELPAGVIGLRSGPMLASVAGVTLTVTGSSGRVHGTAFGTDSIDALAVGTRLYTALTSQWAGRRFDNQNPATLHIGRLEGGQEPPSQVPTRCLIRGTLRALSWEDEKNAVESIRQVAVEVTAGSGARTELAVESRIRPPVCNAPATVARIQASCEKLGILCRPYPEHPVGVSDDFGWYLDGRQGAMFFVGCAQGESHPDLHTPGFDFDESVLLSALEVRAPS